MSSSPPLSSSNPRAESPGTIVMSDILDTILARKAEEIALLRKRYSLAALEDLARSADAPRGFIDALAAKAAAGDAGVIAEIKRASPSKGLLREDFNSQEDGRVGKEWWSRCQ